MQFGDDAGKALLAEGGEHASAHHRLHSVGDAVGEDGVEGHGQSNIAKFGVHGASFFRHNGILASGPLPRWDGNRRFPMFYVEPRLGNVVMCQRM